MGDVMRGNTPEEDDRLGNYTEGTVTQICGRTVTISDGEGVGGVGFSAPPGVEIEVGDRIRLYVSSLGGKIWGGAVNGVVKWYHSIEEMDRRQQKEWENAKKQLILNWEEGERDRCDQIYGTLHPLLKEHIDYLREQRPDRHEWEPYEMDCLADVGTIVEYCRRNGITVQQFYEARGSSNCKLTQGHSAYTFASACRSAAWLMRQEDLAKSPQYNHYAFHAGRVRNGW